MLLVTHDLGVVAQYCQKVVVMYDGEVVEHGSVMDVMVEPQHPTPATDRLGPEARGEADVPR